VFLLRPWVLGRTTRAAFRVFHSVRPIIEWLFTRFQQQYDDRRIQLISPSVDRKGRRFFETSVMSVSAGTICTTRALTCRVPTTFGRHNDNRTVEIAYLFFVKSAVVAVLRRSVVVVKARA